MINSVKSNRKLQGVTQEELAQALKVSRQTIISIESSRYIPSTVLAIKIAMFFNKTVEEIFELERIDFD
ncbi:helix-turn-helix transcriptional regulator [Gaetbulibacter aestuarii]|uniref:Helix-turn-helix transcriptional regulator n=1 Tax=Gaetbulibacter aestuarii TaxID=1502358 RepID=A0ABW7N3S1_9FLAO